MKKILFTCLMAAAGFVGAQAQGSFKIGVRAGSTMYKIDGQAFKEGFNFGYHVGGALEIMFTKKFGIQPEVLFNQNKTETGNSLGSLASNLNANAVTDLKYLSIPVLVNIRPSGGPLMLQFGPQFGIRLHAFHMISIRKGQRLPAKTFMPMLLPHKTIFRQRCIYF